MPLATDPMLDLTQDYSINRFTGTGTNGPFEINFAGGYIRQENVKAYITNEDDSYTLRTVTFTGANTVTTDEVIATGVVLTIYRDTPKDGPAVSFTDGAIINEPNLDTLAKQAVFAAAEMVDRFSTVSDQAADAHDIAESTIGTADNALSTAESALSTAQGAVTSAAAAVSTANATADQFDDLLESVGEIIFDPTNVAYQNQDNTFSGANMFSSAVSVTGTITVPMPAGSTNAVPKGYVDTTISGVEGDIDAALATEVTARNSAITSAVSAEAAARAAALLVLLPTGMIMYWSGSISSVPAGWHLCDGTNGTPDLRGKFIVAANNSGTFSVGNTGGAALFSGSTDGHALTVLELAAHTHTDNGHTHTDNGHTHTDSGHGHGMSTVTTGAYIGDPGHFHSVGGVDQVYGHTGNPTGLGGGGSFSGFSPVGSATSTVGTNISFNDPGHVHGIVAASAAITTSYASITTGYASLANTGSGNSHSHTLTNIPTLPPYYALAMVMKL